MGLPRFIAKRYLFSKKSQNVINIISGISVVGIGVATAALVIVLSAFNGIEHLVLNLFSSFEPQVEITFRQSKTFDEKLFPWEGLKKVDGVSLISRNVEEIAIFRNGDHWVHGRIKGVDEYFVDAVALGDHMVSGDPVMGIGDENIGIAGAELTMRLHGFIGEPFSASEGVTVYFPVRNKRIRPNSKSFKENRLLLSGAFTYNKDVDRQFVLVPLEYARENLQWGSDLSSIEVFVRGDADIDKVKSDIEAVVGPDFKVETVMERNSLIHQTSETEKWMVVIILAFVMLLAAFNMIASMTMLILEKENDIGTLQALGAEAKDIRRIFFLEGGMICTIGGLSGLALGYLICIAQQQFGWIPMEGGLTNEFPIVFKWRDLVVVMGALLLIGAMVTWMPTWLVSRRVIRRQTGQSA